MGRRFPIRRDTLRAGRGRGPGARRAERARRPGHRAARGREPARRACTPTWSARSPAPLVTSSSFMAIQGTGAMAMIVADVPAVHDAADPERALFTLSVLTGVVMLAAGLLRLGSVLRFVSNAVMVGFINAVGVNIVLGQLANFTGYDAEGPNRVVRALNTLAQPGPAPSADPRGRGRDDRADRRCSSGPGSAPWGSWSRSSSRRPAPCVLGWTAWPRSTTSASSPSSLPTPELPAARPGAGADRARAVAGVRRPGPGREHLGQLPEPGRQLPRRVARLRRAGRGQRRRRACSRGCPSAGRCRRRRSTRPPAPARGSRSLIAGVVMAVVIVAFGERRRLRRHARARRPAHAHRLPHHQAGRPAVGVADRRRAEGRARRDVRADDGHPAAVRGAGRGRAVGDPARRPPVEPGHRPALAARRRRGTLIETDPPASSRPTRSSSSSPTAACSSPPRRCSRRCCRPSTTASRNSRRDPAAARAERPRARRSWTCCSATRRASRRSTASSSSCRPTSEIDEQLGVTGITEVIGAENVYPGDDRVGAAMRRAYDDALAWVAGKRDRGGSEVGLS